MSQRRRRRSQRGFTLIELMTVIAIIAIVTVTLASMSTGGKTTPATISDQVTGMLQFARLRAESRRTSHRVQFTATTVAIYENTASGFAVMSAAPNLVQSLEIPTGVVLWAADPATKTSAGTNPAQNTSLPFNIDFRIDGQSTGGTVFLTDPQTSKKHRIFVYKTTGSAMARESW
ncbi:MAG: prepilin-type N-terminal cleavage/methylation domain-containing protein [Deltaproteobacteria bacterium]|nr:prepilin-type N-terminal cleavage/methylation domain-containing protein [Deltaproteobacteria bacterium]